jgi:AMIN domain
MRRARQLAIVLFLAPIASGQNPPNGPTEVTDLKVSTEQETEVRIEIGATAVVPSAEVSATYRDSLVLDLPGTVYRKLPRRIQVNHAGIRAVRLWTQRENPPLTRVVVEIDSAEQYLLSSDANAVVLRVGPRLKGASSQTPNTDDVFGSRTATPAARSPAGASIAEALPNIFRRGPGKPMVFKGPKFEKPGQSAPVNDAATQVAKSEPVPNSSDSTPSTAHESSAAKTPPSDAAQNSTPAASEDLSAAASTKVNAPAAPTVAETPIVEASKTEKSAVVLANQLPGAAIKEDSPEDASAQSAKHVNPVSTTLPPDSPAQTEAAKSEAAAVPLNSAESATPASAAIEVSSAPTPSKTTSAESTPTPTSAAKPEETTSETNSAATLEPAAANAGGAPNSVPDMRALVVIPNPEMRTEFHVKFVEQGSAYLDGGRSSGLKEGLTLVVKDPRPSGEAKTRVGDEPVAQLVVIAVAETSAVTEIRTPQRDVVPGDTAYLSTEAIQALVEEQAISATRKYPAVITFSEGGDALDEEARAFVPKPSLPSVNRATGRIGIDYTETRSNDASQATSSSIGAILRVDFTRIGGTYWNLRGYWRGRLTSSSAASQQTLQDLINRTYHLNLTYENPQSRWVLGVGRMYLPWATSLETVDGGYFGRRLGHGTTLGVFGGSTPDPTSWSYNPNQHLGGAFFNAEGGSYEGFHYSSTSGIGEDFKNVQYSTTTPTGTTTGNYDDKRPFTFVENSISYKRDFSIFQALQVDRPSGNPTTPSPGTGLSRSFVTVRIQPISRLEFSANHTYFRDIPTFDPQLIGTGLLDKYLFQGFSGGVRVEVVKKISVYTDLGRSSRTGDAQTALNQMYGITFAELPKIRLHADAHYSRFTSSFGSGTYRTFSLSRSIGDRFHFEALGGDQSFTSSLAGNQSAKFFTTNIDTSIGALLFMQGGFTVYRGQLQNYNQMYVTLGCRFDNKRKRK